MEWNNLFSHECHGEYFNQIWYRRKIRKLISVQTCLSWVVTKVDNEAPQERDDMLWFTRGSLIKICDQNLKLSVCRCAVKIKKAHNAANSWWISGEGRLERRALYMSGIYDHHSPIPINSKSVSSEHIPPAIQQLAPGQGQRNRKIKKNSAEHIKIF